MDRREFIWLLGSASAAGMFAGCQRGGLRADPYESSAFGNARLLHFTDCHAQLMPVYFREPNVNIGIGGAKGRPPHLVGQHLLDHLASPATDREAHAFTYLDFAAAAEQFGGKFDCAGVAGYERLLENDAVQAVYVSLPNSLHAPWSIRALQDRRI